MKLFRSLVILITLLAGVASAQNGTSPLARYGIGELHEFTTVRGRGMGSVSAALPSMYDISQSNPALWSQLKNIRLQADMNFELEDFTIGSTEFSNTSARIRSLHLSFPVSEDYGVSIVGGFSPLSRADYEIQGRAQEGAEDYTVTYIGTGGISSFRVGTSFKPLSSLYIGASFRYYFGTIDQRWDIEFDNNAFYPTAERRSTSHTGSGYTLGVYYDGLKPLTAAFAISPEVALNGSRNFTYEYSTGDSTAEGASGEVTIPTRMTASLGYKVDGNWLVGLQYNMQDWQNAIIFDKKQNQLGNAYKIGGGVEWIPGEAPENEQDYWQHIAVRLGFSMAENYVQIDGEARSVSMISAGFGFPIIGNNRADLALEYGWSGSDSSPAGSQSIIRITLGVSAGEAWFKRNTNF